ncbi:RNA helicase [Ranunculus cassubicifolius]
MKGEGSNAILMVGKKKSKKLKNQDFSKKATPLSKSQKRKLKKLEEEKVKEALLSESIRTLQKYKIEDDAHLLLKSSGNIGQVETRKEQRERAAHFAKVGLVDPQDDRPSKKRKEVDQSETISIVDKSLAKLEGSLDNVSEVKQGDLGSPCCSSDMDEDIAYRDVENKDCESDSVSSCRDNSSTNNVKSLQNDPRDSLHVLCNNEGKESSEPTNVEAVCPKTEHTKSSTHVEDTVQLPRIASTVVHVSRPSDIEEKRKDLPIVMMEQEIMEAINEHDTVIICGETGCGKTTQVPQFLYEAGFGSSKTKARSGIIGVTQPRRVAVLATAKRVAFELGFNLGREVGYQVRHDKRMDDSCSIKIMTDGILLRELEEDLFLKKYSVVVLDEAHERSLNTDLLIGLLSRTIKLRQDEYKVQQEKMLSGVNISPEDMIYPLKIVLMSATLRVEDFVSPKKLFAVPPPVIEVPARQYPVSIHFSKRTEIIDYMGQAYKKIMSIHKRLPPGGILVFVTGQREVEDLCKKLRKASQELTYVKSKREITVESTEEGIDMEDISEDEDFEDAYEEESDDSLMSDDSGAESEWTTDGDDSIENNNENENVVLGEEKSLSALKAAFDALSNPNSGTPTIEESLKPLPGPNTRRAGGLHVLPLYSMLPKNAQLQVFGKVKEEDRLVVVATNVAETSLTIPGITYVVDTGREKVKNYNCKTGMGTFEVQWISKASASQRSGRAGRTGPGHCYRLYSSAVFTNIFPDFSIAEICKVPVEGVVLNLKSLHIDKVINFPFPTPPETSALKEAEICLKNLEAIDELGKLTPLGKAMKHYPMSPRHSRMLLTVIKIMQSKQVYTRANLILGYAVAVAAALSMSNPFIMDFEHNKDEDSNSKTDDLNTETSGKQRKKLKQASKDARAKFCNPSSDALSIAYALQLFELSDNRYEFCTENTLHLKTMEEMSKLRMQLLRQVFRDGKSTDKFEFSWSHGTIEDVKQAWRAPTNNKHPLLLNEEELLGQAICAGWADRVAMRKRILSDGKRKVSAITYQSCAVDEPVYLHRLSFVSRSSPEFVVYNELICTKQPYMHGITSVKADWLVNYSRNLCDFRVVDDPKPYYDPLTDQVLSWATPIFGAYNWELPLHRLPMKNGDSRVAVFACALLEGNVLPCLKQAQKYLVGPPGSVLKQEAWGQKRVGNLLHKLKKIGSRETLKRTWEKNPKVLYSEIMDWFQEKFRSEFEKVWGEMHREVLLDCQELYPERVPKEKKRSKKRRGTESD